MRIAYIAKHNSGGNDDEEAILHALQRLGQSVDCIHEKEATETKIRETKPDFILCHGWSQFSTITNLKSIPKVFWYFDLVEYPDKTLNQRSLYRKAWAIEMMRYCDLGFFTDGDFCLKMKRAYSGRAHILRQGFDDRMIQPFKPSTDQYSILFFGNEKGGGKEREDWLKEMKERWGSQFYQYKRGIYKEDMSRKINEFKLTIAPGGPVTDNYWSNRVYLMTGYGGFHLHPYSSGLNEEFGGCLPLYNKSNCQNLIEMFLSKKGDRDQIAELCYNITIKNLTYSQKVSELLEIVKVNLNLK